jgi:adenylosuccinate synthase
VGTASRIRPSRRSKRNQDVASRYPDAAEGKSTTVTVVVGAQFGDEAKGKITDYLAAHARFVVRTGGGPNAGHTIQLPQGRVVLHQLACGVLRAGVTGISGPGMVIDPAGLEREILELQQRDLLKGEVVVSERAHVLLPLHQLEDAWEEELRSSKHPSESVGTTRRGIGPAYEDRYGRWGIRMVDLVHPADLGQRLDLLYAQKSFLTSPPPRDELEAALRDVGSRLAMYVRPTEPMLWNAIGEGSNILLEGAQSALLDIDFGTYPFVTSSHPTAAGALVGSGIPPAELDEVLGVAKAYATRVGAGPFPTEVGGEMGEFLQREGNERGATTGRPRRCGWLDLVLLRFVARLNGFTSLAITKADVLGGLDEIPICVGYRTTSGETITDYPPTQASEYAKVTPVYEQFPGWPKFTSRLREKIRHEGAAAVPGALKRFLRYITQETRVPVEYLSFGADRDDTLWLGRGAPTHPVTITPWST